MQDEVLALLRDAADKPDVQVHRDDFGFTWLVVDRVDDDVEGLCTDLHAVNSALEEQGFSTGLLCSLVPFRDTAGRTVGLVYLYKQGTLLRVRPHRTQDPRQPAGDPGPRHPRRRAADGAGSPALARPLGCSRACSSAAGNPRPPWFR